MSLRFLDLMIRYPDGELRNLTREAGYGDADEDSAGPEGSVALGLDGSVAAFVPARRALSRNPGQRATGAFIVRDMEVSVATAGLYQWHNLLE